MPEGVTANWPLKLLALALAIGIWAWVSGEARMVRQFDVPLDVVVNADHVLGTPPPSTILVRLSGPETMMRRLGPAMSMALDLTGADIGRQEILLVPDDLVGAPSGALVELIEPGRLTVVLEPRAEAELPIEPTFLGQPPEGFAFYGATVRPDRVTVEGPDVLVSVMASVPTSPIRLDRHESSFEVIARVLPDQSTVHSLNPRPVQVSVEIDAAPIERSFGGIPVRIRGGNNLYRLQNSRANVTVSGPPSVIDLLDRDQIVLYVQPSDGVPTTGSVALPIEVEWLLDEEQGANRLSVKKLQPREATLLLKGETQI
ncbi:MAG: CdaR family protein [Acidobacteriota bacterium]|nr:CdaR family protein [Acidobacteriota bacterium]MDH3784827.1 CdaR family protein [Acidobacteriota bacterium]